MGKIISDEAIEEIAALEDYKRNGTEAAFKRLKQAREANMPVQAPKVVNADEVVRETMHIQLFCYKDEPLVMDNGEPLLDKQGNQRVGRVEAGTRTAKIKNIAPIDVYTQAMTIFSNLESASLNSLSKEQIDSMVDLILQCWQISEPWMTKEELTEGIDGLRLINLFTRFFFQESPQSSSKA